MKRIQFLDSLRGFAASIVVFHHFFVFFHDRLQEKINLQFYNVLSAISELNVHAVLFFFILSGFSINLSLKKTLPIGRENLNKYLFKRFNRILPLYWMAILFTLLLGIITESTGDPAYNVSNLLGNLVMLQTPTAYAKYWVSPYGDNGPLWSLSFEMFYYAFFPFYIFLVLKTFGGQNRFTNRFRIVALSAALVVSLVSILLNKIYFTPWTSFLGLFGIWYIGFYISELYVDGKLGLNIHFVLLLVILAMFAGMSVIFQSATFNLLFYGVIIACLFVLGYILRNRFPRFFIWYIERPFNFVFLQIGKGSYALYLFHYPILVFLKYLGISSLPLVIVVLGLSIVACIQLEKYFVKYRFSFLEPVFYWRVLKKMRLHSVRVDGN